MTTTEQTMPTGWKAVLRLLILLGLYLTSRHSYLLFHSLAQVFRIVVGASVFILAWNSRRRLDNGYLLFVGIAFLFASGLAVLQMLGYPGMNVFPGYDANLSTQLWILERYLLSASFLISFLFLRRRVHVHAVLFAYAAVTGALAALIFAGWFPVCHVDGCGLMPFKVVSEHIVSLLFAFSIVMLFRERRSFDPGVWKMLIAALILTIASEQCFGAHVSLYGTVNMLGHMLGIVAIYCIYRAMVETGLEKPHRLLFRNLQRSESELRSALAEVQRLAITDSLTGLYNRRRFFEMAGSEFNRARRYGHPFAVIMLDIDHFKLVNDTYGHAVGDRGLRMVAERCCAALRETDVPGRYGGEEFIIMLPETDAERACQVAERLRASVVDQPFETDAEPITISVSIGLATLSPGDETMDLLLKRADQALYRAKRRGRNQVCCD